MKKTLGTILFLFAFWCTACGGSGSSTPIQVRELSETEKSLVESSNRFGFDLFGEVIDQSAGGNVFISPLSVSIALGMTFNGAGGSTSEGMRQALRYGDLPLEEINRGYQELIGLLTCMDPDVVMEIANSIWYRQGFEVLQSFLDAMLEYFDALVNAVDFSDPSTKDVINAWVKEKTHDKIDKIIDQTSEDTVMILVNAIYFKGTWTWEFDPADTRDETFTTGDGLQETVPMMHMHADLPFLQTEDFMAVDLPYGGKLFSMTVFLPAPGRTVDDLVAMLDDASWEEWMSGLSVQEVELGLPRFELEYETQLNDVLSAMGMQDAFIPGTADFSGIKPEHDMWISRVKHKTYVKVNEEGTEAAAVTSVEIEDTAAGNFMMVNRPFLLIIHDAHSKAMMFMGKISDPAAK